MIHSIELFSGTGGLALGLQQSGFAHIAMYERDRNSCENLRSNIASGTCSQIEDWDICQTDVCDVDFSAFEGKARLVAGGPPCQPFSLGGKGLAHEDRRDMFPQAVRAVREIKPQAFIFENVRGLLRKSFSTYFNYILLQLTYPEIAANGKSWRDHLTQLEKCHTSATKQTLRYNVTFRLLNAADYGVPQQRHRVFIVGFRDDIDAHWTFPEATHSEDQLLYAQWVTKNYWEEHGIRPKECPLAASQLLNLQGRCDTLFRQQRWVTTRDALSGLPDPSVPSGHSIRNHDFHGWAQRYAGHTGSQLDAPSKTIKAGAHGVPGGENALILDDGRVRYYTVREAARLQTFPDTFTFSSSWTESMRQIGNAVPVRLANVVGSSVAKLLSRYTKTA